MGESTAGRFHAALAAHRAVLEEIGGWPATSRADFDQQLLARLGQVNPPGDPCAFATLGYVFRWGSALARGARHPVD